MPYPYTYGAASIPWSALASDAQTQVNNRVLRAGDTMTGNLGISSSTAQLTLTSVAGNYSNISFTSAGSNRWLFGKDNSGETGSNAGSNFFINSYTDAGAFYQTPVSITRSTGVMNLNYGLWTGGTVTLAATGTGVVYSPLLYLVAGPYAPFIRSYNLGSGNGQIQFINSANNNTNFTVDEQGDAVIRGNLTALGSTINFAGQLTITSGGMTVYGWSGANNTGVIYFGQQANQKYLYYDGTEFNFNGAPVRCIGSSNAAAIFTSPALQIQTQNSSTSNIWQIGSDTNSSYCVFANGSTGMYMVWGATAWTANSDERLKDIKGEIKDALSKVKRIRSVLYSWKDGLDTTKVHPGVIAQDIQKVQPESVTEGTDGFLGVAYTDLIPLALAAIKELAARVETFEARLNGLHRR